MIGVFDSGIGGLTVVHELKKIHPHIPVLYVGDTARLPYGTKTRDVVRRYAFEIIDFLIKRGATHIVIACNTVSALAARDLEKQYTLPIFNVIDPAVEEAKQKTKTGRIGIIGTPATIQSGIYQKRLHGFHVFAESCPLFVPLVEEGWTARHETRMIAMYYLSGLKRKKIDTLILGCTHYPLLTSLIHDIMGPDVTLINSAKGLARSLMYVRTGDVSASRTTRDTFFVTDDPYRFEELSTKILGRHIKAQKILL